MKRSVYFVFLFALCLVGQTFHTSVHSDFLDGPVAIRILPPPIDGERFESGSPILIAVPGGWDAGHFTNAPEDLPDDGICVVSFLMPGTSLDEYNTAGEYDTRGENCIEALKIAIQFASGNIADIGGNFIDDFLPLTDIDTSRVGLFGGSNGGNLIMTTLSLSGVELAGMVDFVVTYESPTSPQINVLDLGYGDPFDDIDGDGNGIFDDDYKNPWYREYNDTSCIVDMSKIAFYIDPISGKTRVFLDGNEDGEYNEVNRMGNWTADINNNGIIDTTEDFLFSSIMNALDSTIYYSTEVSEALYALLGEADYPENFGAPVEAADFWYYRSSVYHYDNLPIYHPDLKLMSVFNERDHAQVTDDKVNIRHGYNGFHRNGLWVRLNPDSEYLSYYYPAVESAPDNPANKAPLDWESDIMDWANSNEFPNDFKIRPAILEMFDRSYYDVWSDPNLDGILEMRMPDVPPIYTSVITHSEEPPCTPAYFEDSLFFQSNRDVLKIFADELYERDIRFNWQSDWNFLYAASLFDHGVGLGGLNIAQYLQDSVDASIDPHAHETTYNYADIVYFLEMLDVEVTSIVGGFIAAPPEDCVMERFFSAIEADSFPGFEWTAEILWGGAKGGHVDEETLWVSGIWRPEGCDAFLEHDPDGPLPYIGGYKTDFIGIEDQLSRAASGEYDASKIYTQTLFFGQSRLNHDFTNNAMLQIDDLQEFTNTDKIRWRTLQEVHDIWVSEYDSEPNMVWFNIPIYSVSEHIELKPEQKELMAFPNPFNSKIQFKFESKSDIEIYDINGLLIQNISEASSWTPSDEIHSGMYFAKSGEEIISIFYIK